MFSETRKEVESNYAEGNRIHNCWIKKMRLAYPFSVTELHTFFRLGCSARGRIIDSWCGFLCQGRRAGCGRNVQEYSSTQHCKLHAVTCDRKRDSAGLYLATAAFLPLVVLVGFFSLGGGGGMTKSKFIHHSGLLV